MEKYIKLDSIYDINENDFLSEINNLQWLDYSEYSKVKGYHGYGLMQFKNSDNPEHDSLSVNRVNNLDKNYNTDDRDINEIRNDIPDVFKDFLNKFEVPINKARLGKMLPNSLVPPHIDIGYENITRIHWPLVFPKNSYWHWYENNRRSETMELIPGKAYAMDTMVMHSVQNKADSERIHLIVNVSWSFKKFSDFINDGGRLWKT